MDDFPTKKTANVTGLPRRQTRLSIKDVNHEAGSSQCCKSLNCSTKLNCTNRRQIPCKPKTTSSPPHASGSKDVTGNSCRLISSPSSLRKTSHWRQTPREVNMLSNRNKQDSIMKQPTSTSTPLEDHTVTSEGKYSEDSKAMWSSLQNIVAEGQYFPATNGPRIQGRVFQRSDLGSQSHGSSSKKLISRHSAPSGPIGETSMPMSCSPRAISSRYNNMRCSSTSNMLLPSRFCMSQSGESNRLPKCNTNERSERENSARRGKRIASSSSAAMTNSQMNTLRHNVSFTSSPLSLEPRRSNGGRSTVKDRIRSAGSRRVPSDIVNVRLEDSTSSISLLQTSMHSTRSEPQLSNPRSTSIYSSSPSSTNVSQPYLNTYGTSESNEMVQDRPSTDLERSSNQGSHDRSHDDNGYRHFYLDGIAEVLSALERIKQDEELTYEQLVILETNLFLGGLAFHDQHRDMRMDIDHMTYEELLALEEKMGSVSTEVSEEALSKCLRKSLYSSNPAVNAVKTHGDDDDVKCSVCQEEYADKDEVARLPCDHRYHLNCIDIWLRLKNWCPICKAPAVLA